VEGGSIAGYGERSVRSSVAASMNVVHERFGVNDRRWAHG
jgi:hypothetical protein